MAFSALERINDFNKNVKSTKFDSSPSSYAYSSSKKNQLISTFTVSLKTSDSLFKKMKFKANLNVRSSRCTSGYSDKADQNK
jgi:hypothetical protein